jgi:hypothetical protein
LHWIYYNRYDFFRKYYKVYKNSEYTISLVPFENDYLFRKWGINSILISNFIAYEYNDITPSDLSSKIILMIGRGDDRIKRFDLGIKAMKNIIYASIGNTLFIYKIINNYETKKLTESYEIKLIRKCSCFTLINEIYLYDFNPKSEDNLNQIKSYNDNNNLNLSLSVNKSAKKKNSIQME